MKSPSTLNDQGITFTFDSRKDNLFIKALFRHSTYEIEIVPDPQTDLKELQRSLENSEFNIISQTNDTLKVKIGNTELQLPLQEKAIANEFSQTITTLSSNIQNQLEKNARLQAETKRLRTELDELKEKFSQMSQRVLQLARKVDENQNLKNQLKQVKEELAELKRQESSLFIETKPQNLSPTTSHSQGTKIQVESQQTITADTNEDSQQLLEDIVAFITKKISIKQEAPIQEQPQKQSQELLKAFHLLSLIPTIQWRDFNNSKVITTQKERETIKEFFGKDIVSMQLLYSASENMFSVRKFHEKCNNILNTLIFVKTEFNKVIGGFTPLKWQSPYGQNVRTKRDQKGESFIFSLTEKEKLTLRDKENAIVNKSSWGPVFGIDLIINDKANLQAKCYFKMNGCYKSVNDMKETNNLSERHLGGGKKNHFKVLQWQVWHVQFNQEKNKERN